MKLTIKPSEYCEGQQMPSAGAYDAYIDDYKLGRGVTGINLDMTNPARPPKLTITADLSVIDIDADVLAKMKDEQKENLKNRYEPHFQGNVRLEQNQNHHNALSQKVIHIRAGSSLLLLLVVAWFLISIFVLLHSLQF